MPASNEISRAKLGAHKLKILMVAPTSFFNDYGGHIRILEETLALQSIGHEVVIVTYYQGYDIPGLNIQRTWALPWRADYEVGSSRHKLAFDLFLAAKTILVGFKIRPDVVHGHMHEGALIGNVLARMLRKPLIFDFQGSLTGEMVDHNFLNSDGRYFPWVRRLEGLIDRYPDKILTSSHRAQSLLSQEFGVESSRIVALPDCVDTDRFDPEKFTEKEREDLKLSMGIPAGRPVVAYLGLLADYQGTPHLLEAAALLKKQGKSIHFLIMGYPNVEYYRFMAEKLGVSEFVTFTGRIRYDDAPRYLSLGDVAVSPKVSATEGSGKVLNYMAMSLPTVAYDTLVHREYLADIGSYVPPGDVKSLAETISILVADPASITCLGQELRQRAIEKYSWRHAGIRISQVYADLVTDTAPG